MSADELAIRVLDFEAEARVDSSAGLRLSGNADAQIVTQLDALVGVLHEMAVTSQTRELVVDIRALEFMNAACFNVLVAWVSSISELDPDQRYHLRFATNPKIPWQRRSIRTLSCFATDLVTVEA